MGVNFWGMVYGVRTFLPHVIMSGGGHIVNTASMAGLYPGFAPAYDSSKHAVVAMTESLYHNMQIGPTPGRGELSLSGLGEDRHPRLRSELARRVRRPAGCRSGGRDSRSYVRRAIDEGMQPGAVADLVVDAMPHRSVLGAAPSRLPRDRRRAMAHHRRGTEPVAPEETPGMPPRSQIVAEVLAAMGIAPDPESTAGRLTPAVAPDLGASAYRCGSAGR